MKKEIDKAVETFHNIAFGTRKGSKQIISDHQLASFVTILTELLVVRYEKNWYPDNPIRASGYRCLRMNGQCVDPAISESLNKSKILFSVLRAIELTIWVDPGVVSVRIGEEGSIGSESVEMEAGHHILPVSPRSSDDEAYISDSPSPPPLKPMPQQQSRSARRKQAALNNAPSIHHSPRMIQQPLNVSPPSSHSPMFNQDFHHHHPGHIPTSQHGNYTRPRSLFSDHQKSEDGHQYQSPMMYKNNLLNMHRVHQTMGQMQHMRGHYLDIPAQA